MSSATLTVQETNTPRLSEQIMAQSKAIVDSRPSPDDIDAKAREYLAQKVDCASANSKLKALEEELLDMVQNYGIVVPKAEKSRRLNGRLAELTLTKSDVITINDDRVEMLREALDANGFADYFKRLFTLRSKYEIVEGAESALKDESLPKRLSEKVLNLFGRCIAVKAKKPALKVAIADPSKPAKRSKKGASK